MNYTLRALVVLTLIVSSITLSACDSSSNQSHIVNFFKKTYTGESDIALPANTHFIKTKNGITILKKEHLSNTTRTQKVWIHPNNYNEKEEKGIITLEEKSLFFDKEEVYAPITVTEDVEVIAFKPKNSLTLTLNKHIENSLCTDYRYNDQPVHVTNSETAVTVIGTMNMQRIITGVAVGLPLVLSIHKCLYTGETVDDTLAADVLSLVSRTIWRLYTDLAYLGWGRLYGRFK